MQLIISLFLIFAFSYVFIVIDVWLAGGILCRVRRVIAVKIAVAGTDARYAHLKNMLAARGHTLTDSAAFADLVICGTNAYDTHIPEGARGAWCAPTAAPDGWTDIKDEQYLVENARLTAEGAICAAMNSSDAALNDMPAMVIGFGRIGSALAEMLACLCAKAYVFSRRERAKREIEALGARFVNREALNECISHMRVIFVTSPGMALDETTLARVDSGALIIDLAGAPYGVDIAVASAAGLRARRESGLPGRYCPESAAAALLRALKRGGVL